MNQITFDVAQPGNAIAQLEAATKLIAEQRAMHELKVIESEINHHKRLEAQESLRFGDVELVNRFDFMPTGYNYGYGLSGGGTPATFTHTTDRVEGRDYPFVLSETDLNYSRGMARFVTKTHCPGVAIERNLKSHVVSTGSNFTAGRKKDADEASDDLISSVQDVIDEFVEENKIDGELEQEWFWRPRRDGDICIGLYPFPKGRPGIADAREIDPERIRDPGRILYTDEQLEYYFNVRVKDESSWSFGIHTDKQDVQKQYGITIDWDSNDWEYLPSRFFEFRKVNVDRNIKRGMTDFYPAWSWLKQQQRLLLNTAAGSTERAAISYIIEHVQGIVKGQAVSMRQDQANYSYTINGPNGNSNTYNKEYRPAGVKLDVPKGQTYRSIADGVDPSGAYLEIIQAILRSVGSMWAMPEGMISGKMDAGAYASAIAAGSLFCKYASMEQSSFIEFMKRILWKVLRFAYERGRFEKQGFGQQSGSWQSFKRHIEVVVKMPDVATQDPQKQEIVRETRRRNGVLSIKTWRDEVGLDDETETRNIADEPQLSMAGAMPGGDGMQDGAMSSTGGPANSGRKPATPIGAITGPSQSQFGGAPKNYTDIQSFVQEAVSQAIAPLMSQLKMALEEKQDLPKEDDFKEAKGQYDFIMKGLRIHVENPVDSIRSGVDDSGKAWSIKMKNAYGEVVGTTGADFDPVDVFVGPNLDSDIVFVVNQVDKDGEFDETKSVLGAVSRDEAEKIYMQNYDDDWKMGTMVALTFDQWKCWLENPARTRIALSDDGHGNAAESTAMEVRAPAGFTHDKPLIVGNQQFTGGQYIPNATQADVNKAVSKQVGNNRQTEPQSPAKSKEKNLASLGIHGDSLDKLLKEGPSNPTYHNLSPEQKTMLDKLRRLTKKKKKVTLFPIEQIANVNEQGKPGEFKKTPPCIIDDESPESTGDQPQDSAEKKNLLIGNDIVLFAKSIGKDKVPAIMALSEDKEMESLLGDDWAKWMYSRVDKSKADKSFSKKKSAIESLTWLDYLPSE